MNYTHVIIFGLFLQSLLGCNTPVVPSAKVKKIYIASDFLTIADSALFQKFGQKEHIKIEIVPMSTDSIVSHYNKLQYNSTFDMVFMKSTYSLDILSKNEMLHVIPEKFFEKNKGFSSPESDWIIIGIDPYIIRGLEPKRTFQYNELTHGKRWKKDLTEDEIAAFQSAVLFQFGRKNMNKSLSWLEKIETQSTPSKDTSMTASYFLSRLSNTNAVDQSFVYPNQTRKFGVFYDGIGIGIVKHSSKYNAILSFIEYHSNLVFNQDLCNKLNILPIRNPNGRSSYNYQNNYPILFRCTPKDMALRFRDLKRIRKRINK